MEALDFSQISQFLPLLAGLIIAAMLGGFIAGLLGVGGGIVIVPALFWLFSLIKFTPELAMHTAVGTSLATIVATSVSSMRAHHKKGAVDWELFKGWLPTMAFGALSGGIAAKFISADALVMIFACLAILVAFNLIRPVSFKFGSSLPSRQKQGGISGFIGFASALMGIGGGTLSVPILVAYSFSTHRAVGTAASLGFIISVPATIGFVISGWGQTGLLPFSLGYVNLIAVLIILPFTILFAPIGAKMAHQLPEGVIKKAFAIFLFATAARMIYRLIT